MSRSPIDFRRERVSLGLCPDRIGVVRRKAGWRNRKQAPERGVIDVAPDAATAGWKPALDAVGRWVAEYNIKNATAALTLSNAFARFALLPWSRQVTRGEEEMALARARFENQYGDMTGWTVELDRGRYGAARVACAVETELIEQLRHLFTANRIVCDVVQPYFVAGWNCWRSRISQAGKTDALFAVAESDAVVMASVKAGHWHSLRATRGGVDAQSLPVLLEREALLQGFTEMPRICIQAPSLRADDVVAWPEQMCLVDADAAVSDTALAMALAGDGA